VLTEFFDPWGIVGSHLLLLYDCNVCVVGYGLG
jgi:hypothetical protein